MEDAHTAVLGGIGIADGATAVGAAIVDEQELEVGMTLSQDAVYTTLERARGLVYGDDDGEHVGCCFEAVMGL